MEKTRPAPPPPRPYIPRLPQKADVALHEFVSLHFNSFPVQFVVTRCCDNAVSVSLGDHFVARSTDTIDAIFLKDSAGNEFSLLQHSDAQLGFVYDPHDSLSEAYLGFEFDTAEDVINADVKPKLLRVTKTEKDKSVEKDELLVVRKVKRNRLKVYSITKNTEKKLSKSCKGCFTTAPYKVALPLSDLIDHVPNVFQSKAVLVLGTASNTSHVPRHWVSEPVTVFRRGQENVLVAQRTTGEWVNIPVSLNIYVQVLYHNQEASKAPEQSMCEALVPSRTRWEPCVSTLPPGLTSGDADSVYQNLPVVPNDPLLPPQAPPTKAHNGRTSSVKEIVQSKKEPTTKSNVGVKNFIGEKTDLQEDEYIAVAPQTYSTVNKSFRNSSMSSSSEEQMSLSNSLDQSSKDFKYDVSGLPKKNKSNVGIKNFIGEKTDLQEDEYIAVAPQTYSTVNKSFRNSSMSSSSEEQISRSNSLDQSSKDFTAKHDVSGLPNKFKEPYVNTVPGHTSGSIYENLPCLSHQTTGAQNCVRRTSNATELMQSQEEPITKDSKGLYDDVHVSPPCRPGDEDGSDSRHSSNSSRSSFDGMRLSKDADKNRDELKMLTVEQVLDLLDAMDLSQYKAKFAEEHVTGSVLSNCDEDILKDDLGVMKKLHQIRLSQLINGESSVASIMNAKHAR